MEMKLENEASAQELPKLGTSLKWDGRSLSMVAQAGGWRLRSRSKSFPVDFFFATPSLPEAKRLAREKLSALPEPKERTKGTLEDVAALYLAAPKRCAQDTAEGNVSRLRSVVDTAFGQTLDKVQVDRLSELWPAFVMARQGGKQPDYSTRSRGNHGIVSAMKQAASVFLPALQPYYRRQGVSLPSDAVTILWPAVSTLERPEANDDAMVAAWENLRQTDVDLWLVIGLARFAGLRQSEILACRGKWFRSVGPVTYVDIKDREADGFQNKTGRRYSAMILHAGLVDYLTAIQPDASVVTRADVNRWIQREPQAWLKPYTGAAKAPLHRLRGLYADQIKRETEQAILARAAGIKAASESLGHTTVETTVDHYLDGD